MVLLALGQTELQSVRDRDTAQKLCPMWTSCCQSCWTVTKTARCVLAHSIVSFLQCVQDSVETGAVMLETQNKGRLQIISILVVQEGDSKQIVDPRPEHTGGDHCMLSRA